MIVVDVETTGIDEERHSIASIGAVDFHNPGNEFYQECRIWKGAEISPRALEVNGFKEYELYDPSKPPLSRVMQSFIKWTRDITNQTLAGENPTFDRNFLNAAAKKYNLPEFGRRVVDLHAISYGHHLRTNTTIPLKNNSSRLSADETYRYVGLPTEPQPHNALTGAKMEAEAFSRLIYGRSLLDEFSEFEISDNLKK